MRTRPEWRALLGLVMVLAAGYGSAWAAGTQTRAQTMEYQRAMFECRSQYFGRRSPATDALRPMMIENCFKLKTGKFPWQAGVTIYPAVLPRVVREQQQR